MYRYPNNFVLQFLKSNGHKLFGKIKLQKFLLTSIYNYYNNILLFYTIIKLIHIDKFQ